MNFASFFSLPFVPLSQFRDLAHLKINIALINSQIHNFLQTFMLIIFFRLLMLGACHHHVGKLFFVGEDDDEECGKERSLSSAEMTNNDTISLMREKVSEVFGCFLTFLIFRLPISHAPKATR